MKKSHIVILAVGCVCLTGAILAASFFFSQKDKPQESKEATKDVSSVELATMEVFPEKKETKKETEPELQTEPTAQTEKPEEREPETERKVEIIRRTLSSEEEEESRSLSRNEFYYGTEPEDEDYTLPSIEHYTPTGRPNTPPEIIGITKEITEVTEGKQRYLVALAQTESFRYKPECRECRVDLLENRESDVIFGLFDGEELLGFIIYHKDTGVFEGETSSLNSPQ